MYHLESFFFNEQLLYKVLLEARMGLFDPFKSAGLDPTQMCLMDPKVSKSTSGDPKVSIHTP